jgi:hypothetical protein
MWGKRSTKDGKNTNVFAVDFDFGEHRPGFEIARQTSDKVF